MEGLVMATAELIDVEPEVEAVRLPDLFEVIYGEIVEVPEMSFYAVDIANILNAFMVQYLLTHRIGRCWVEQMFHIPVPDDESRLRRPDVAFISYERLPKSRKNPLRGFAMDGIVPDLVVEVISPTDRVVDVHLKLAEYLNAGVRTVWVIVPLVCQVFAYASPTDVRIFAAADLLDGGEILPGFSVRVVELFPETEDEPAGD